MKMTYSRLPWLLCALLAVIFKEAWCLRDVRLTVAPPAVQRGHSATLLCQYDLEGAPLYSVKWYRGTYEFYRFVPSEMPANKMFPYPGIYVQPDLSNSSQVVLREVSFTLSGNFSCEVTTDAPSFSTAVVSQQMSVIELPESAPVVVAERDRYTLGDTLRANCTSPPSRPPAELTFQVNGMTVGVASVERHAAEAPIGVGGDAAGGAGHRWSAAASSAAGAAPAGSLQWSTATLNLQLLPLHFSGAGDYSRRTSGTGTGGGGGGNGGSLHLTCTAHVNPGEYQRSTSVQLAARLGEPVHQRENGTQPYSVSFQQRQVVMSPSGGISSGAARLWCALHHLVGGGGGDGGGSGVGGGIIFMVIYHVVAQTIAAALHL